MSDVLLADLNKNGRETIRIAIREFKGSRNADLRLYATNADGQLVPTAKGVSLRPSLLRPVIDALVEAERVFIADRCNGGSP